MWNAQFYNRFKNFIQRYPLFPLFSTQPRKSFGKLHSHPHTILQTTSTHLTASMSLASLSPLYVILVVKHWTRGVYDGHVFGGAWVRLSRPLSSSLGRGRDTTAAVDPLTARAYNRSSSGTKDVARREFVSILRATTATTTTTPFRYGVGVECG